MKIENLPLDLVSVAAAAAVESFSSILVLLDLLFLVTKGHVLKLLIFRLFCQRHYFSFHSRSENQLKNKDSASLYQ